MKLSYEQCLIRKAASLARVAGLKIEVSDSKSSNSSYLYCGILSAHGGLKTLVVLRASDHAKPGSRAGWGPYGFRSKSMYDLRISKNRKRHMDMIIDFVQEAVIRMQNLPISN